MEMQKLNFRASPEHVARVVELAALTGRSTSGVIRMLIETARLEPIGHVTMASSKNSVRKSDSDGIRQDQPVAISQ